ncbi:hypothetical protein SAMN05880501_10757 [Ureibacillus xyleni]|uniref:Uncharacterized protein n=1 Tax=Ureibacillus xyleni TaxID=614648 RepID=A0A285SW15_9BACL|nr:HK97 gp10 family phage protein [Ureibacillus xyleni]SOC12820.1 hypothetical protein SAMN05880501_10757 [Ureibacillus xyleni]
MAINISDLAREINKQLAEYVEEVAEEIEVVAEQVAKDGVKKLKLNSPKLTGSYAKGWRAKKVNGKWIVHNKTDYQLTHLLEKSHVKANGTGRVEGQPHIAPVEKQMIDEFARKVEEVIRQ